jgi:hypothetical protein
VRQLQHEITSSEFAEWQAYESIDPFGSWRDDMRMGKVCSAIANQWGASTTPKDFIPDFEDVEGLEKKQTPQATIESTMMAYAKVHNKIVERQ